MNTEELKSPLLHNNFATEQKRSIPDHTEGTAGSPEPIHVVTRSSLVSNEEEFTNGSLGSSLVQKGDQFPHLDPERKIETFPNKSLKFFPLVALIYNNVSGGPFGIETTLRASGVLFTLVGVIAASIIWAIPEALMTAELGTVYPDPSGSTAWIEDAFGERAAILCGFMNWISGVTDNALYPGIFLDNFVRLVSSNKNNIFLKRGWSRFAIVSLISTTLTAINCLNLNIVGSFNVVTTLIGVFPFVLIFFTGLPKIDPKRWLQMPDTNETYKILFPDTSTPGLLPLLTMGGIMLRPYVNNLFWNTTGYHNGASYSSEVRDIRKEYPKAFIHTIWITVLTYLFPVMVCTGVMDSNQKDYVDGYFTTVAKHVGGKALGGFTVFGAALCQIGLFQAEMSSDSLLLMGMAKHGYAPKIFAHRNKKFGTPIYSILLSFVIILVLGSLGMNRIINMENFCVCVTLILEYASYLKLRYNNNHEDKPFRVPIPFWGIVILLIPPLAGIGLLFLTTDWITLVFTVVNVVIGLALHDIRNIPCLERFFKIFPDDDAIRFENDTDRMESDPDIGTQ